MHPQGDSNKYGHPIDGAMEDQGREFRRIAALIGAGDDQGSYRAVEAIVASRGDDPFILVKCAALLYTMDRWERGGDLAARAKVMTPEDPEGRLQLAVALRGLGEHQGSVELLTGAEGARDRVLELARSLAAASRPEEALSALEEAEGDDAVMLRAECLSRLNRHDEAVAMARSLHDGGYRSGALLLECLLRGDRDREARSVAERSAKRKGDADGLALKCYIMRVRGRTAASMNYANQALKLDSTHPGALWNLALCLLEKGRTAEAKLLAGAINDADPGSPLAMDVLRAARS